MSGGFLTCSSPPGCRICSKTPQKSLEHSRKSDSGTALWRCQSLMDWCRDIYRALALLGGWTLSLWTHFDLPSCATLRPKCQQCVHISHKNQIFMTFPGAGGNKPLTFNLFLTLMTTWPFRDGGSITCLLFRLSASLKTQNQIENWSRRVSCSTARTNSSLLKMFQQVSWSLTRCIWESPGWTRRSFRMVVGARRVEEGVEEEVEERVEVLCLWSNTSVTPERLWESTATTAGSSFCFSSCT